MNVLREPVEVGRLRYAWFRPQIVRMWLRTSAAVFVLSTGFLWLISRSEMHLPRETSLGLLAAMLAGDAVFIFGLLPLASDGLGVWKWDERGLRRGHFFYRWGKFQRFRVRPDPQAPVFPRFTIQFRGRFMQTGVWLGITSHPHEIAALVETVRRYVPQEE